jgi:uridine kinase
VPEAEIHTCVDRIFLSRRLVPAERCVLVAITGIDGCGKGFVANQIVAALQARGVRTACINVDGWLNLPAKRFDERNPAGHFYWHAIRFEQLFSQLVLPLRDHRQVRLEAEYAEETATSYRTHVYDYRDVDVIVLEGIYLLKRAFQGYYDLSVWIKCSVATALERAIARAQEGLPPEATIAAYRRIYFPAQEIHFLRDDPEAAATITISNDPNLTTTQGAS